MKATRATLRLGIFRKTSDTWLLTLSIYLHTKHEIGQKKLQEIEQRTATRFIGTLNKARVEKGKEPLPVDKENYQLDLTTESKIKEHDIILFVNKAGFPMYAVMVNDIRKGIIVAEQKRPFGLKLSPLSDVLRARSSLDAYLFKSSEVETALKLIYSTSPAALR